MLALAADVSLRILAAAAAVGFVLVALRVRSGAARHAAWSAVLAAMLTMPVLMAIVPTVDVPVPSTLGIDFGAIAGEEPLPSLDATRHTEEALDDRSGGPVTASFPHGGVAPGPTPRIEQSPFSRLVSVLSPFVLPIYVAGAVLFSTRLIGGWWMARRLVRSAVRVDIENRAPVLESPAVATPLTTGVFSPSVLLPVTWREWPADKLAAVLAHENAHIARRDAVVAFLAGLNRAIFWFHPLSWWLERTLAVTAEHACDETAAREVGQPRRYAEVLLDMAEAVRIRGHRVSWGTIGVDGSGLLGARIDRLLRGDAMARMSGMQRAGVALGCALVLVLAIACRQQIAAEPLRPDPEVQKQIDDIKARGERHKTAVAMSAADAEALEESLKTNPDNVEAREKLIIFYDQAGKVSWEEKLAGIRRHSLWRLAHLPETDLWIPHISKRYDPDGYAQAMKLWLEHTSKPDVTPKTLGRAAAFLSAYDKPMAEELLLRAHKMDPAGPWASRLGDLYAGAIVGAIDPRYRTTDEAEAKSPFADEARRKLEATSDAKILATAGYELALRYRHAESVDLGRRLLERAATLDPQNAHARSGLLNLERSERRAQIQTRLDAAVPREKFDSFSDEMYAAVSVLPEDDRLFYLPGAAESAYMRAENVHYTLKEKPTEQKREDARKRAAAGFARARQYATDALALAERHRQSPDYGDVIYRAHTTLGVVALKDGDRRTAVKHMAAAADAPGPAEGKPTPEFNLRSRLVEYLLREGERESVAQYLEKSAARFGVERDRLLNDAKQIRAGIMPPSYQSAEARR